uniref:Uncharacterized protein n=1 Tax=Anguilla anguilla TaxID=7936 RepID=A0A0E9WG82_ANGAN
MFFFFSFFPNFSIFRWIELVIWPTLHVLKTFQFLQFQVSDISAFSLTSTYVTYAVPSLSGCNSSVNKC